MPHQPNLFSNDAPQATDSSTPDAALARSGVALSALKFSNATHSPEQQRFNKLLTRTENLAKKIEALRTLADAHRPLYKGTLHRLEVERSSLMRNMVLWLDERLKRKGLSAKHKRMASELICNLAAGFALAGDEAMQQLHDAHSDQSLAEQQEDATADMQKMMEDMLGQPLGDGQPFTSMEELLRAAKTRMDQQTQEQANAQTQAQAARQKKGKESAHEQQVAQHAQDADGALRTIYRQLVSALHPDRESDTDERTRKTALMKEVNAAYERRDLLVLMQLQLRAELTDGNQIANLAREKVAALSLLLKERCEVLARELSDVEMRTIAEFQIPPHATLSAGSLKRHMVAQMQNLQADIAMMKMDAQYVQDDAGLKRWLQEQQQMAQDEYDPFGFDPFF